MSAGKILNDLQIYLPKFRENAETRKIINPHETRQENVRRSSNWFRSAKKHKGYPPFNEKRPIDPFDIKATDSIQTDHMATWRFLEYKVTAAAAASTNAIILEQIICTRSNLAT